MMVMTNINMWYVSLVVFVFGAGVGGYVGYNIGKFVAKKETKPDSNPV